MAREDLTKQGFWAEMYEKERTAQLRDWYRKTRLTGDPSQPQQPAKSRQFQVFSQRIEAACPRPTAALEKLRQRKTTEQTQQTQSDTQNTADAPDSRNTPVVLPPISSSSNGPADSVGILSNQSDMIRPDSRTTSLLYSGSTREARQRYLRTRQRRRPESRFTFPVVSSWEYGWKLDDVVKIEQLRNPVHGRNRIIADTFYRPNVANGLSG